MQGTNGKTFCFQSHSARLVSTDEGNTGLFCNNCQYLLNTLIPDSVPFILCITSLQTRKNAGGRHRCYLCLQMRKARLGEMKQLAQCRRTRRVGLAGMPGYASPEPCSTLCLLRWLSCWKALGVAGCGGSGWTVASSSLLS